MDFSAKNLAITVHKLQFKEDEDEIEDISCCLFLDTKLVEIVNLSFQENLVLVPLKSPKQHLQLIFKRKSDPEILGCISIVFDSFTGLDFGIYSQWLTLFDDPEDDIFDGDIGQDDLECPRAYVTFQLFEDTTLSCAPGADEVATSERDVRDIEAFELKVSPECYEKMLPSTKRLSTFGVQDTKSPEREPDKNDSEWSLRDQETGELCDVKDAVVTKTETSETEDNEAEEMECPVMATEILYQDIDELRKTIAEKNDHLLETLQRLQKQTECYEEQFKTMNDEAVELKLKISEQESLIEVLQEQLASFNEIQSKQVENQGLFVQIQSELSRYQATVENLEFTVQDLQEQYEKALKREQHFQGQHEQALNKLKELESQHQIMTSMNEKLITENQSMRIEEQLPAQKKTAFEAFRQEMEAERQQLEEQRQQLTNEKQLLITDKQQLVSEKLQLVSDKLLLMKDKRNIEKEANRVIELEQTLEFYRRNLISDNLESVFLKAELVLSKQQNDKLSADLSAANQKIAELEKHSQKLEDEKAAMKKEIVTLSDENLTLKNEIKEIDLQFEAAKAKEIENRLQEYNTLLRELQSESCALKEEARKASLTTWDEKLAFLARKPLLKKEIATSSKSKEEPRNLQKELQSKTALIQELHYSNNELKAQNTMLKEKAQLNESLLEQLNEFRKMIKTNEKERQMLQEEILKVNASYIQLTHKYLGLNTHSTPSKNTTKPAPLSHQDQNTPITEHLSSSEAQMDEIDQKLHQILSLVGLPSTKFVKLTDGIYSLDNNVYNLYLDKGTLYVQENGRSVSFLEFVKFSRYKIGSQRLDRSNETRKGKENETGICAKSSQTKSASKSKRPRLSLHNVTVDSEKVDEFAHSMNLDDVHLELQTSKAVSRTPGGGRMGGVGAKSSEKRSSIQKPQIIPGNPSFLHFRPKNFKAMGPVLMNSKHC